MYTLTRLIKLHKYNTALRIIKPVNPFPATGESMFFGFDHLPSIWSPSLVLARSPIKFGRLTFRDLANIHLTRAHWAAHTLYGLYSKTFKVEVYK